MSFRLRTLSALRSSLPRYTTIPSCTRYSSTFGYTQAKALVYSQYGPPSDVLKLHSHSISPAYGDEVTIRFLASPINPADINQIEGVYPTRPPLTTALGTTEPSAVPGNEALVEVQSVGANVKNFKKGDRALMRHSAFGTWRTHASATEKNLTKIDDSKFSKITDIQAATVSVNPCTAYRMLKDFVKLEKGDWFIQNGANSGVGRAAIQLARIWGLKSVNIVRSRPNLDELKEDLTSLGADLIVTEEELGRELKSKVKELTGGKGIRLALNCVGGRATTDMIRQLADEAHVVTYGGMARQPVIVPASQYIFKDLHTHGFWVSRWSDQNPEGKREMLEDIFNMMLKGEFKEVPVEKNIWTPETKEKELKEAVDRSVKGFGGKKQVFVFEGTE
ncbi:NAD(P)-binding protein [Ascodesmis nigricans]|uniref:enoyl-[acyl-carrier-protein] reductase n=1 Tax=Ascodesmis nigricans TaxID=341454 RepID=A0A4S2MZA4_9PEZI|nr:NAD(P)-binding protein [Ascodesmis nigricans]